MHFTDLLSKRDVIMVRLGYYEQNMLRVSIIQQILPHFVTQTLSYISIYTISPSLSGVFIF